LLFLNYLLHSPFNKLVSKAINSLDNITLVPLISFSQPFLPIFTNTSMIGEA